jgi:hypothetical protein
MPNKYSAEVLGRARRAKATNLGSVSSNTKSTTQGPGQTLERDIQRGQR